MQTATIRRSNGQRRSIKKGGLRNFVQLTRKHLCQSLFNFIKNEIVVQVFSCEFCEIFYTFFTKHHRATASGLVKPSLNSDLNFISKISGTALPEAIVSYKPLPSLSQENKKTFPSALLKPLTL